MTGFLTSVVGAFVEAWAELRVNKLRVLLSLVGVAVAVCSLTAVVGLGSIVEQSTRESNERATGRPASYVLYTSSTGAAEVPSAAVDEAFRSAVARYDITYASANAYSSRALQLGDGLVELPTQVVDVPYGEMHRVGIVEGRWFDEADASRLAPAVVVDEPLWRTLGSPPVSSHPTVEMVGSDTVVGVVVGVSAEQYSGGTGSMYVLPSDAYDLTPASSGAYGYSDTPQYEMWLPPEIGDDLSATVAANVESALGDDVQVDVSRNDYLAYGGEDPFLPIKLGVTGVGVLVLLLGGLGLVNIALVTVRQRIREIGVRRSVGATAPRVFFSVMLESVAGTVVAGAVGVMVAVLVVENPTVQGWVGQGSLDDLPPFPVSAALVGLGSATLIGAVAGLLPALVAVRVKVIDAIRY